jgi:hypothetical protein
MYILEVEIAADQLLSGFTQLCIRLGSNTQSQPELNGRHWVSAKPVNIIETVSKIKAAVSMHHIHRLPCWRRKSMHMILILVKVTVQTSRIPDIKLYFKTITRFGGGIDSM